MNRNEDVEVSAFEAKTHLADLLRKAEQGQSFVIRRRGKAVARLVPAEAKQCLPPPRVLAAFQEIRRRGGRKLDVRALIAEGRRH